MTKRSREAASDAGEADAAVMASCGFCGRAFKARGLKTHQRRCPARLEHAATQSKYRFCIVNENAFELVLSFLSNQALTKLQLVTGDHYAGCESSLSRYCCPCEEDKPAVHRGLCTSCEEKLPDFKPRVTTTEARGLYGIRDLSRVPCVTRRRYTLFNRVDLDVHALATFGSYRDWLRNIAQRASRARKLAATKQRKQSEYQALLVSLSPNFASYVRAKGLRLKVGERLKECSKRYDELVAASERRGLQLRTDSRLCCHYIVGGGGSIDSVLDTMEEMAFLYAHTTYATRCNSSIESYRQLQDGWIPRDEYSDMMQNCRNEVKRDLCLDFLQHSDGHTLPRKWERCRARFEEVKTAGGNPHLKARYIYAASGD